MSTKTHLAIGLYLLYAFSVVFVCSVACGEGQQTAGQPQGQGEVFLLSAAASGSAPRAAAELPTVDAPPASSVQLEAPASRAGRTLRVRMEVTAYCPCPICCSEFSDGVTASGAPVTANGGAFVAADTDLLAFGTMVSVPAYHPSAPVPVLDRGGAITGMRLDVFFPTHDEALMWGRRHLDVTVHMGEGERGW